MLADATNLPLVLTNNAPTTYLFAQQQTERLHSFQVWLKCVQVDGLTRAAQLKYELEAEETRILRKPLNRNKQGTQVAGLHWN